MKTLDEVIEALKNCITNGCYPECPYEEQCKYDGGDGLKSDTIHYLKEYRDRKETLRNWTEKAISEQQNLVDAYMLYKITSENGKDNPALTWEELRQMVGKPVWFEYPMIHFKGWILLDRYENGFIVDSKDHWYLSDCNCETWQAYRKERT